MTVYGELVTGYLALIAYDLTLLPSNIVVFSGFQKADWRRILLKNRREIGLVCFSFSIIHGLLTLQIRNADLSSVNTYIEYLTGFASILIMTALAMTSNNWSLRKLGKNWKKLHSLTYLALIILMLHLLLAKQGEWDWYTWCGFFSLSFFTCLWLLRSLLKWR